MIHAMLLTAIGIPLVAMVVVFLHGARSGRERRFVLWSCVVWGVVVLSYGIVSSWLKTTAPSWSWIAVGFYLVAWLAAFKYLGRKEREAHDVGRDEDRKSE